MITVAKLRRKPRHFQAFTGMTVAEFDQLLAQVVPAYQADRERRRNRNDQQRPVGVGHPFTLAMPERLLMALMYLRLYMGQSLLSYLFVFPALTGIVTPPDWAFGLIVAAGAIFGAWLAAKTQRFVPEGWLKWSLGAATALIGALYVANYFFALPFRI